MSIKASAATLRKRRREQKLEQCAIAAVQMLLGTYSYQGEGREVRNPETNEPDVNWAILCRLYRGHKSDDRHFHQQSDPYFIKAMAFHYQKATDPLFQKGHENEAWRDIVHHTLVALYNDVVLHSMSLSISEKMRILDMAIKTGVAQKKLSNEDPARKMLSEMTGKDRDRLIEEREKDLKDELGELKQLRDAYDGSEQQV